MTTGPANVLNLHPETTHEEIVTRLRSLIPQYLPEWTDYNASDPGITLIELFAWLTESLLYQLGRVPERNFLKFLDLLGVRREPARPAAVDLTVTPTPGVAAGPVPRGSQVGAQGEDGALLVFEIEAGLDLVQLPLEVVAVSDGVTLRDRTEANRADAAATFHPFGRAPAEGSALYLGFGPADPPPPGRPFPDVMRLRVFAPPAGEARAVPRCTGGTPRPTPPVRLVWEYLPGPGSRWRPLPLVDDDSIAFTRDGYLLVGGPDEIAPAELADPDLGKRCWLRCRLASGTYPPGREPEIDALVPNTVRAVNLTTERDELVGISEGHPDQTFPLQRTPVHPGSLELWVTEPRAQARRWIVVNDLLASGPADEHAALEPVTGTIRFGDGTRGRIPVAQAEIVARTYRYGGGPAGNLPAGAVSQPITSLPGVEVTNHRPAVGGQDVQSVADLAAQAPTRLRHGGRAVTGDDFAALAREVAGVADAVALPLHHPAHEGPVPGAVTVVVVPDVAVDPGAGPPRPTPELLAAVCAQLDAARLLTTELFVVEPDFVPITVEAAVEMEPYAASAVVRQEVEDALRRYLDPLGRYRPGADRGRAPFGRRLRPTNLFTVIGGVADVVAVQRLRVLVRAQPHEGLDQPVQVPPDGLVFGAEYRIDVRVPEG